MNEIRLNEIRLDHPRFNEISAPWQEWFESAVDGRPGGFAIFTAVRDERDLIVDFTYAFANRLVCEVTALSLGELVGRRLLELNPEQRQSGAFEGYRRVVDSGKSWTVDFFEYPFGDDVVLLELQASKFRDGVAVGFRNMGNQALQQRLLSAHSEILELIAWDAALDDTMHEVVMLVEHQLPGAVGGVLMLNDEDGTLHPFAAPRLAPAFLEALDGLAVDGSTDGLRRHAEAHGFDGCWSAPAQRHGEGPVYGLICAFFRAPVEPDLRQQRVLESAARLAGIAAERDGVHRQLEWQALHDPLTRLPNRALLLDRLEVALARAKRSGTHVAVIFLDLDRFKDINDSRGHTVGDQLLVVLAGRLAHMLRSADTVARFGGDEFVIVAGALDDADQALRLGERLLQRIAQPIVLASAAVVVTASVGVVFAGPEESPELLLRQADVAMYRAKDRGGNQAALYEEEMGARVVRRHLTENALRRGLQEGQVRVHYQPVIDLHTLEVTGVEALARWEHPERGLLPPGEFIGLAEQTNMIHELGSTVLKLACQDLATLSASAGRLLTVSVNLSARQLTDPGLAKLILATARAYGTPPAQLCLEVTESILMDDAVAGTLDRLDQAGVRLSIDDFGTGYSSLLYLKRLPVSELKIDMSFVRGLDHDGEDAAIVTAIVHLAADLHLVAVAEGVETPAQLERLVALGCPSAQGFLFSKAQPAEALTDWLHDHRAGAEPAKV